MDGIFIFIGAIIIALHFLYLCICYITATIKVTMGVFSTNLIYITLASILPFVWWAFSTTKDDWNFYARKKLTLRICILNAMFTISQIVWLLVFKTAILKMTALSTGRNFTVPALLNLCRIVLAGSTIGIDLVIFFKVIEENIFGVEAIQEALNSFTLSQVVDTRENKENLYDLNILREIEHGTRIPIKEHDRFVHQFFLGSSGTGKTSTTLLPSIICDLDNKYENGKNRKEALFGMLKKKQACVVMPEGIENPDESNVSEWWVQGRKREMVNKEGQPVSPPVNKKSKEYKEYKRYTELYVRQVARIRKKYGDCGITVMAPNNSLNDDVIRAAAARHVQVNVIDPAKKYDKEEFPNVRQIGINPFYVPFNLMPDERQKEIADKAENFADVLLAVSEIHGIGDQYFRDINESVTTNVATVCMLNANLEHRQTGITEVQRCINDFGCLTDMVSAIQKALHMEVIIGEIASAKKDKKNMKNSREVKSMDVKKQEEEAEAQSELLKQRSGMNFKRQEVEAEGLPEAYKKLGMSLDEYVNMCEKEAENYYETIHFVLTELLGAGNEKMYDQARGLRNIINRILQNPDIKDILGAKEDFLDWDTALRENQITVINTALELGPNASTALGLFVMLLMKHAIMRRPKKMRSNHFLYIDEAAQYMHPMYEDFFALYRQYGVACTLAMQSLSQMEKTPLSKYLRGVIMGAGVHIVFGRISPEEMKVYEAMSGMTSKEIVQISENSNSEFDENYSITRGMRTSVQKEATLTGDKARMRQFREVTVFMIDEGNVKSGFVAKVSFSNKADFRERPETDFNFAKFADFDLTDITAAEEKRAQAEEGFARFETDGSYSMGDVSSPYAESAVPVVKSEDRRRRLLAEPDDDEDDEDGKKAKVIQMPESEAARRRLTETDRLKSIISDSEDNYTSFRSTVDRASYEKEQRRIKKAREETEKRLQKEKEEEKDEQEDAAPDGGIDAIDDDPIALLRKKDEERKARAKSAAKAKKKKNPEPETETRKEEATVQVSIPDGFDDMNDNLLSMATGASVAPTEDSEDDKLIPDTPKQETPLNEDDTDSYDEDEDSLTNLLAGTAGLFK
ncbi:MAG: TraM recognition domain-containing protein [Lachnospiraceae bacterium]|nr:TraM recognition domain-containing protein [Lachnospiraceae bacterium]